MLDEDDLDDAGLKEAQDSGHVTLREYRAGLSFMLTVEIATLILVVLILIHLVTR